MTVVVPGNTPVKVPEEEPIVTILVLALVHVPPPLASLSVWLVPAQVLVGPRTAVGKGLTVTIATVELRVVVVGMHPTVHI